MVAGHLSKEVSNQRRNADARCNKAMQVINLTCSSFDVCRCLRWQTTTRSWCGACSGVVQMSLFKKGACATRQRICVKPSARNWSVEIVTPCAPCSVFNYRSTYAGSVQCHRSSSSSSSSSSCTVFSTIRLPERPMRSRTLPPLSRSYTSRGIGDTSWNLYSCS